MTLTMGALKKELYLDAHKAYVGEVRVLELGVSRQIYEKETPWHLLEPSDLQLPHRTRADSHKGSYGHLNLLCGEKNGAAVIAALAALRSGSGLVTLISNEPLHTPYELMVSHTVTPNATALALGMGLGSEYADKELEAVLANRLPLLLDADIFSMPIVKKLITRNGIVLTPHPKEFVALLKTLDIADIDVATLQKERFAYAELFAKKYPNAVLLLKGANMIIAADKRFYINPNGTNRLAKGGSGDVLGGLVSSYLAQGFAPLQAAINGSLLLSALDAQLAHRNNFSLSPLDLIDGLKEIR